MFANLGPGIIVLLFIVLILTLTEIVRYFEKRRKK